MSSDAARRGRSRKSLGGGDRQQSQIKMSRSAAAPTNPRSIPAEKDLTSIDNFKKPFVSKDFVEGLSRRLVYQQAEKKPEGTASDAIGELFDPKPFQDQFDGTLTKLLKLRAEVDAKINSVAKQCQSLEKDQQRRIAQLRVQFDNIFKDFKQIDMTTNKISTNAVRIGGILEGMDAQRDRAIFVHQYFEHIIRLNDGEGLTPQDAFGDLAEYDLAILLKNLLLISAELDMSQTKVAKANIERMSSQLERSQLDRFVQAAAEKKYAVMQETARILFEFNGGDTCIREYINRLGVFLNIEELKNYKIYEPPPPPPPLQKGQKPPIEPPPDAAQIVASMLSALETNMVAIDQFMTDVQHSLLTEWDVIDKVFPGPSMVFSKLAESVFSIRIDKFVEIILENASGDLNLYLGTFSHLVQKTTQMCQTLTGPPVRIPLSRIQSFADSVFRPYTDQYIDNEIQSMLKFYVFESDPASAGANRDATFFQWSKGKDAALILTPELTISCFDRFRDAMRRCVILSHSTRIPRNMSAIFQTFMKEFGEGMTVKSLDSVIKGLSKVSEVRDVQDFFELIQSVNTNAVLIENHFADIKPHIDGNREEFEACLRSKTNLLHLLEDKIAAGLDKVLTAQIAHVKRLLKKNQTSSDFYPSSRGPVSFQATPACISVCKYVKDQHNLVSRCLDGANVEIFLHEFGSRMLLLILRHIKKWTIETQFGVLILISDLTAYQDSVAAFGIDRLNQEYDILKSLGKLYMVAPEQFKELIADSPLRALEPKAIEELIRRRSDYQSSWLEKFIPK